MTLVLTLPLGEYAVTGKQVSFVAPCESHADLTHISIQGKLYSLVDSIGNPPVANAFTEGAIVSVILNNETSQAFIQNSSTSKYLEELIRQALIPAFTEAQFLESINKGDSLSTIIGKVAKLISHYLTNGGGNVGGVGIPDINVSAMTLPSSSKATVTKTANADGTINLTFGIPKGENGSSDSTDLSALINRVKSIEEKVGEISIVLDAVNGEVV